MSLFRKQGGGGFLNGVSGAVTDYTFESKEWKNEKKGAKNSSYHTLTLQLNIRQDGAEEDVKQFLKAGFFYPENQGISEDGKTLHTVDEDGDLADLERPVIDEDSEAGKFLQSLIDAGWAESDFGDNGSNFEAIINRRLEFEKRLDREAQIRIGKSRLGKKAAGASEEDILKAGRTQDKNDKSKFYNVDYLAVREIFDDSIELDGKKGKSSKSSKKDEKPVKAAKGGKKSKKDDSEDLEEKAVEVLKKILEEAEKPVPKNQLSGKIVAYAMDNDIEDDERDALRKIITDEEFLGKEDGWSWDQKDKKQPVSLD